MTMVVVLIPFPRRVTIFQKGRPLNMGASLIARFMSEFLRLYKGVKRPQCNHNFTSEIGRRSNTKFCRFCLKPEVHVISDKR